MMTKVLVYGYCVGVFSSRRIERRWPRTWGFGCWRRATRRTSAPSRISAAPSGYAGGLFEEVLKIALEAGALKLGRVAWTAPS